MNVFFLICEVFVAFYSNIPEHKAHLQYLFAGLHGHGALVPWMWASMILMGIAIILLLIPTTRNDEGILAVACVLVFIGTWIDKGMGMISGGFVPNPLHEVTEYMPTLPEILIALGVWALGLLVLTALFKMATAVKEETYA
jgi:molybdopterin-containing oxidoreductase family membrane subunit